MAYSITVGETRDLILVADPNDQVACDQVTATGSMVWSRFINGEFDRGCLINGKRIEIAGRLVLNSPAPATYGLKFNEGRLEITIHGTTRFDLSFHTPAHEFVEIVEIVINQRLFNPTPGARALSFALEDSTWKLTDEV